MIAVSSASLALESPAAPKAAATQTPDALTLENISFSRDGEIVLDNVSLRVTPGEFLAVLGPNGGGKTTLLRIILGLLKPDAGTARIFGTEPHLARTRVGYVPQFSTIRQNFPATVLDMTLMGAASQERCGLFGGKSLWRRDAAAKKKALEILDLIGIADLAGHPIHALSGGQRQRLMVARALMGRDGDAPFLMLLDEPTASIDPQGKWCFFDFLGSLRGRITLVVVSHELAMASPFFNRVALVNKTLTVTPSGCPDTEIMRAFIGAHGPDCPVEFMIRHSPDCAGHTPHSGTTQRGTEGS